MANTVVRSSDVGGVYSIAAYVFRGGDRVFDAQRLAPGAPSAECPERRTSALGHRALEDLSFQSPSQPYRNGSRAAQ